MTPDQLFNAGLKSARAGDFYGAVINFRLAASFGEESAEIHRLLGKAHVHLGELDRAELSFRRALILDSRDEAASLCLATLRKYRSARRTVSTAVLIACAAAAFLVLWYPWQAYRRLDASLAAIDALKENRTAALPQSGSAPPAAPRAGTLPSAPSQTSAATPSSRTIPQAETSPPARAQSRPPPPPKPTGAKPPTAQVPQPAVKPAPPAAVKIPSPNPTPVRTDDATPVFENRYKEAVAAAFKGNLKQALEQLSAIAGDEYANQPLAGNVHFWMGRCLYELGKTGEAREHFRRVLEQYPKSPKRGEALIDLYRCERKLQTQSGERPTQDPAPMSPPGQSAGRPAIS